MRRTNRARARRAACIVGALVFSSFGCKGEPERPAHCTQAYAAELEQKLLSYCRPEIVPGDSSLPELGAAAEAATARPDAMELRIFGEQVMVEGVVVPAADLSAEWRKRSEGAAQPPTWSIFAQRTTSARAVMKVLESLLVASMDSGSVELSRAAPAAPSPPDPSAYDALRASIEPLAPEQRALELAKRLEAAIPGRCRASFEMPFSDPASARPPKRCTVLAGPAAHAITSCGCENETQLITVLYVLFDARMDLQAVWVPVRLSTEAAPTVVRADETWGAWLDRVGVSALNGHNPAAP